MKKILIDISENIIHFVKNELSGQENTDNEFYVISPNDLFKIEINAGFVGRRMNLKNYHTEEMLVDEMCNIINNLKNSTKRNILKSIHYVDVPGEEYNIDLNIKKIDKNKIFNEIDTLDIGIDQKVINIIMDSGDKGISATELNKQTKSFLSKTERNILLNDLLNQQVISIEYDRSNGRKKKVYKF